MTEDPFAAPQGTPPDWPAGHWAGAPAWPAPVRERAPGPVVAAAVLSLVGGGLALALGLFLVVTVLGIVLAPLPLLLGGLSVAGGVLVLRGGRTGVVLLTALHALLAGSVVLLEVRADETGDGVPLLPLWSVLVVGLLWLPASQRWLWRRGRAEPWQG